jgi:hypothetical protein
LVLTDSIFQMIYRYKKMPQFCIFIRLIFYHTACIAMNLTELVSDWITKVEKENPPGTDIVAINFGMMQSGKNFMVYITGAEVYDANDDDWAGEIDYQPIRANKYFTLPAEATTGLKRAKVLELVIDTLKQLVKAEPGRLLFANRAVTASFDDDNLTLIKKG